MIAEIRKKIELYLYNFNVLEEKINTIMLNKSNSEFRQIYEKYIENKEISIEDQIIKNISYEIRIIRLIKWQNLIKSILDEYKEKTPLKYSFIVMKYFQKATPKAIENKIHLTKQEQKDIKYEVLQYIFLLSKKDKILEEVS